MKHRNYNGGRLRAALFGVWALACGWAPLLAQAPATSPPLRLVVWEEHGTRALRGMNDLLTAFHESHPGVRVNLTTEEWSQASIRLRYWCHTHRQYAPDLTILPDVWLGSYAAEILPMEERLRPKDTSGLVGAVLDRCRASGKLVGVPWMARSRALYYRADLLEAAKLKPPQTLAQLKAAALALADPPGRYGLGLPAQGGGGALDAFLDLLDAQGGQPHDDSGALKLTSPQAQAALAYWVELRQAGALQPEGLSWPEEELQTTFIQGRVGMVIGGPELLQRAHGEAPDLKVGVAPLPVDHDRALPITLDVLVALNTTRQPAQVTEFLRFMATAEAQRAMSLMGGLPTYRGQLHAVEGDADVRPFVLGLEQARGLPMQELDRAQQIVEHALLLALSGRETPAAALQTATDEANEANEPLY